MNHTYINKMKFAMFLCIATLGVMYAAFYNGYPLVTSDSGTYIDVGFHPYMPVDRPPFYSIFLRYSSLWTSLWFPVFVQSALLTFLLYRLSAMVYGAGVPLKVYVTGFIAIISFTCVSWVSSFLMADIFTAILALAILLFLYEERRPLTTAIYLLIVAGSIVTHNSHFIITLLFSAFILAVGLIKKSKAIAGRALGLLGVVLFCYVVVCSLNFNKSRHFVLSKGSHVFMMGKLAETGILNTYLDDNCATKNYKLCAYKNDIPIVAFAFLWFSNSPLYKTGGWDSSKQEYDSIIHDVFTTPKYLKMFAIKSAISTMRQMTQINMQDKPFAQDVDSGPYIDIHKYFRDEDKEFLLSKQNQNNLNVGIFNIIYDLFFVLSSIFVLWYLPQSTGREKIKTIYFMLAMLIFLNAFTTATFANVLDRLQYRVFWLLPALNAMLLVRFLYEKIDVKK